MPESQNVEYKSTWRDEYLKWVCGFANTSGGTLYVGVHDDGTVAGIDNYNELLVQLPNKLRDILGVFAEVNLQSNQLIFRKSPWTSNLKSVLYVPFNSSHI